ncbi:hydrogenase assembly chaperone HypC/HupF [Burkholderiales bacterium JOSHI_001]|nr:hydrogenase assembly chaperone HypC/HupF [Burkholderiales bacterium JOSHI_001]
MCLAVPMQVLEVNGLIARCSALGELRDLNLVLLMHEDIRPGDHLVAHRGQALRRVSAQEAAESLALFEQMLVAPATALEQP